jgi:hypothetical protein
MFRWIWLLMLAGLLAAPGCERKFVDRMPKRVEPAKVRRDAEQPPQTMSASSQQTAEAMIQEKPARPAPVPMPAKVAPEDTPRDVSPAKQKASTYSKQARDVFQKKLSSQIDELDGKITNLRDRGRNLKGSAKDSWEQMMAELDVKRDAARAKLNKLVHSSGELWDNTRKEVESAWDDLDNTFRTAWKKF